MDGKGGGKAEERHALRGSHGGGSPQPSPGPGLGGGGWWFRGRRRTASRYPGTRGRRTERERASERARTAPPRASGEKDLRLVAALQTWSICPRYLCIAYFCFLLSFFLFSLHLFFLFLSVLNSSLKLFAKRI
jgi:hypothetical protein